MEFKSLDHLFDEALERFDHRAPASSDPYKQGPLSADHFLLKKSWEYFKGRIRAIESHWEEIAKAKDTEVAALRQELQVVKEELGEAELKNQMLDEFEESVRQTRTSDYVDFQRLSERLKASWEEERQNMENKVAALEFAWKTEKEKSSQLEKKYCEREKDLLSKMDSAKEEMMQLAQKTVERSGVLEEGDKEKSEQMEALNRKVEILKEELSHRDSMMKSHEGEIVSLGTKVDALLFRVKQTDETVHDRDLQIQHLKTDVAGLEEEKMTMRQAWHNERAEWRELWDRARSLWENKKGDGK